MPLRSRLSLNAGLLLSKSTVHAFGLPAFLLIHMPGTVRSLRGLPIGEVEPQLVADDAAAAHRVDVVHASQLLRRLQALVLQRLRVVAALHRAVRARDAELAAEVVAAVARDDVEDDARGLRFAEAARGAEHDFLRAGDVRRVAAARAAAGPPGVVAVAVGPRVVAAAAVDRAGAAGHAAR